MTDATRSSRTPLYLILRGSRTDDALIWDLAVLLLGRGHYRAEVAPDALEALLRADRRFVDAGWRAWMLTERVTPETAEAIRRRKKGEAGLVHPVPEPVGSATETPSIQSVRRAMERSFADIGAIFSQQEFASLDEANAVLQGMLSSGGPPRRVARTPLEQAQDIMYDAWDEPDRPDRIRLAGHALQISADCADAYFWGIIETRPYMRARLGLAEALWASGKKAQAVAHAWDMIRLNPGNNQGMRSVLISWLLEMGEQASVERLLDLFPDDATARGSSRGRFTPFMWMVIRSPPGSCWKARQAESVRGGLPARKAGAAKDSPRDHRLPR